MRPIPMRGSHYRSPWIDPALLLLRLALGFIFMAHGSQKLFGFFGGAGLDGYTQYVAKLGFSMPQVFALLSGIFEFLGGAMVALGVATGLGAGLILTIMLVAIWKVTGSKGFFIQNGGTEYNLLIMAVCICLIMLGPGRWAVWRVGARR